MVNKILFSFVLLSLVGFMFMSAFPAYGQDTAPREACTLIKTIVYRGTTFEAGQTISAPGAGTPNSIFWGTVCLINTLNLITNYIFLILFVLAALAIAIAGIFFVMGSTQGDSAQVSKARDILIYAVVGIAVALLARVIPALVSGVI